MRYSLKIQVDQRKASMLTRQVSAKLEDLTAERKIQLDPNLIDSLPHVHQNVGRLVQVLVSKIRKRDDCLFHFIQTGNLSLGDEGRSE